MGRKVGIRTLALVLLALLLDRGGAFSELAGMKDGVAAAGSKVAQGGPGPIDTNVQGGVQYRPDSTTTPGASGGSRYRSLQLNRRGAPKTHREAPKTPAAAKADKTKSKNE